VVPPAGDVTDHHVGHRHHLAVFGLLDEDGHAARDELAVELDALRPGDELPVGVVSFRERREERGGCVSKAAATEKTPLKGLLFYHQV